jgi:hypothetical protein
VDIAAELRAGSQRLIIAPLYGPPRRLPDNSGSSLCWLWVGCGLSTKASARVASAKANSRIASAIFVVRSKAAHLLLRSVDLVGEHPIVLRRSQQFWASRRMSSLSDFSQSAVRCRYEERNANVTDRRHW